MNWTLNAYFGYMNWTLSDKLQFGLLVTTFLAVIVALFGEKFREWIWGPNINLKFDKKSDRCFREATVPNDHFQNEPGTFYQNVKRAYSRLKVDNEGRLAKNVKVKIEVFDSEKKEIPYFEPSTLNWISGKEREDLAKKEVNYVNICSQVIDPNQKLLRVVPLDGSHTKKTMDRRLRIELYDTSQRGIIWDRKLDNYIFKIIAYGDNFDPITKRFEFKKPSSNTLPGDLVEIG